MKQYISPFTLFISMFTASSMYGMLEHALVTFGPIEKQVFLNKVKFIGKQKTHRLFILSPSLEITTIVDPYAKDLFSQLVVETIQKKEQKENYQPKNNNSIENYTYYWHQKAQDKPYIELKSTFKANDSLLKELNKE